jgi:sugar lactone lactonase YvrE
MPPRTISATTVIDGLHFAEGPRWHDGALYFSDMHAHRVIRMTEDGTTEIVAEIPDDEPSGLGWLPDGRLLVVAMETQTVRRVEPDGSVVVHADLSAKARGSLNDMIVAADGTAYVGDMGSHIQDASSVRLSGQTFKITPDGSWSCAADDLEAPNGHILTDDGRTLIVAESGAARLTAFDVDADGELGNRRVFASLVALKDGYPAVADGICLDEEGAVWYADPLGGGVCRVLSTGEVTDQVRFDDVIPAACVLGGADRKTLYICVAADWKRDVVTRSRTGRIDACQVTVPGAGRP